MFSSIQGEGKFIGVPTFFIRSIGCNLRCSWCDTRYAFDGGKEMSVDEIVSNVGATKHVSLTGGEPMIQKEFIPLLKKLTGIGKYVTVETNGSVDISQICDMDNVMISMDIKCPSSGMSDRMLMDNIELLKEKDQLKFVISDDVDFEFAESILLKYSPVAEVIFSPVGGMKLQPIAEKVIEKGLNVRVLPQLHKIIWGDRTGV